MKKTFRLLLSMLLCSAATLAVAQSGQMDHPQSATRKAAPSPAEQSFRLVKSLAGVWEGHVTMTPAMNGANAADLRVTMRVTSRGHALVHELKAVNEPDDPSKYDHPVTMIYVDGNDLDLVHYCDAGNRPKMVARPSSDGKSVEFDIAELSGSDKFGHMNNAAFTFVDANHHVEEWTYMMPGNKPIHVRMELHRVDDAVATASGK